VQYLQGLVQYLRSTGVSVRGVRPKGIGKDPLRVVEAAIEANASTPDAFQEIWVVVDVDDHATLSEALQLAESHAVSVVVTNPCFELWLLWHYEDCEAFQSASQLAEKLRRCGHSGKNVPTNFPYRGVDQAVQRGTRSATPHSVKGVNPSSAMPHLVSAIRTP
jgi:hypothetical protein